ncbi:MAG TPA: hypothetical protein VHC70_03640 [Phycisphaerales bacterium]|jgi:hypothetical protein|nr:hypothetical protein [Phycisphaerales bacterium]
MSKGRTISWLLVIVAAAVFVVSIVPLSRRIEAYNKSAGFLNLHGEPISSRELNVEGFPKGALTDAQMPDGSSAVRLDYAGKSILIPVKAPAAVNLPGLAAYDEWLKVLAIYEVVRDSAGRQERKPGSERLIIVVRRTPEGYDPDKEGEVRRTEWVFDYYDLKKDGTVEQYARRWPRSLRAEERLRDEAAGHADDPARIASAKALIAIQPLKDRTIEHFAAMHVIPKLAVPDYKFNDTAFRFAVLGWPLPAAMCSVLVFTCALVFAIAPRRKKQASAQ